MAQQVITIEIPVEVTDKSEPALSGITAKLSKMEQAFQKLDKAMKSLGKSKIEDKFDKDNAKILSDMEEALERFDGEEGYAQITVDSNVEQTVSAAMDSLEMFAGFSGEAELNVSDHATGILSDVENAVESFDGEVGYAELGIDSNVEQIVASAVDSVEMFSASTGLAEIGVEDSSTPVVRGAEDAIEEFAGSSGSAEIGAHDTASSIIDSVRDKLSALGGMAVSAVVGAIDNASSVIDSVKDKASAWAGTTWNATIGIVDTLTSPLNKITGAISNPIAQAGTFLGVSVGLADSVNTFKDFEAMMSQVSAISGATGSSLDALTAKAKEMGATTKFTATESAEAFNYMAMAGWKTEDMLGGIEGIMNLAAASGESLGSTSDIVTDALTAFGLKASDSTHFADVLAQASANANTNVGMLGESFKYVAPVAGAMNYSIEDTSLALGLMANASVKGSMAGTALKTSLANMASPTASMTAAMEKYGISLTDSEGNMKSLGGVIENLRSSLGGLSETEQTAAADTIFGKEAMAGMLAIINASEEDYNKLAEAIYNADGASQRMADTMLDNLAGSMTLMQSAVDGVKSSLGERLSPYLRSAIDSITESMPGAEAALTSFMDKVDARVNSMVNSEAWENADIFGKVNISWNKLIAEPFIQWAGNEGGHLISKGFVSLFSSAGKALTGQGGLTDWLSLGVTAKATTTAIGGIKKLATTLGEISPAAGQFGIAAAAVTAGVTAIAMAIDNYNQKQISANLEDHFGNISLSLEQVKELAGAIVPVDITAKLELANVAFDESEALIEKAEEALQATDYINWKVKNISATLSEEDGAALIENTDTFVTSITDALEKEEYAAELTVTALMGENSDSDKIISTMHGWFEADSAAMSGLSDAVTKMLESSIEDGTYNVNTATAISILQAKMLDLANGAKQAELQGKLDWLSITSPGAALDSESWAAVVKQAGEYQAALMEADTAAYQSLLFHANQAVYNDPSRQGEADAIIEMVGAAYNNMNASTSLTVWDELYKSLSGAYGEELGKASRNLESSTGKWVDYFNQEMESAIVNKDFVDPANVLTGIMTNSLNIDGYLDDSTRGALKDRYEALMPTIENMQSMIDRASVPAS